MEKVVYILIPLLISALSVPLVKKVGTWCEIYAVENERTVHSGIIARCGGIAIYVAFMVGMSLFMHADKQMNALMIGGSIVFFSGLLDDMLNLKPKVKLLFQVLADTYPYLLWACTVECIPFTFWNSYSFRGID